MRKIVSFILWPIILLAITATVSQAQSIQKRISANSDDAEEASNGTMNLNNTTLSLGQQKWVGVRFRDVGLPKNCTILNAYVEMESTAASSLATQLTVFGQAHDDAPTFGSGGSYITNLAKTTASVTWNDVDSWTNGEVVQTPNISEVLQELVNRTNWASTSDVNILVRSDDLTGSRSCHAYNGSSTKAPLLVVEYTTSTASITPTSDRLYVERYASRKAISANTWLTVDMSISPYQIPPNKVVEIAILNTNTSTERWGGVRAVDSSLNRRFQLHEAEGGGGDAVVMHVQANSSSSIEIYASSTTDITFYVLGYWTTGTYTETMQSFTASSSNTWQDRNLGTYGLGANQVAEIVMTNSNTSNERSAGVRTKGSSLSRVANLHEAQDGGIDASTMFVRANKSSDAIIQTYAGSTTDVAFNLVGYWKRPPGKFTETYTNLGVPSSTNTWQDKSLIASGVPAKGVAEILLVNTTSGTEYYLGLRENNSTNSRRLQLHQAKDGGGDLARLHVTADSSSIVEWNSATTDANRVDILLTGYWTAAPGEVLVVVANEQTPSTQALERLTLLEGWGYTAGLIDDEDSQSDFDTALASYSLVYVPQEVNATVGTKLSNASLGIVSEHASLMDDFGFAEGSTSTSGLNLSIANATHYITSPFSVGSLTIFTSTQSVSTLSGKKPSDLQSPGQWSGAPALATLEAGGKKYNSERTTGRRVQLPWGGAGFDITLLNNNGRTILQRSLQWASSLKVFYQLNETSGTTATDSSGHHNHAVLSNGLSFDVDATQGKLDGGLSLNGGGGYFAAPASPSLELSSAITVTAWINPTLIGLSYVISKDRQSSYYFRVNANGSLTAGNAASGWVATSSGGVVQAGSWQHVAMTYDSVTGKAILYVNGVAVTTQTGLSGTLGINSAKLAIGSNNAGDADYFTGTLDDLRIYNYALTLDEIGINMRGSMNGIRVIKWIEVK